jgi:chromosomal replication initiation ATPase DnaA
MLDILSINRTLQELSINKNDTHVNAYYQNWPEVFVLEVKGMSENDNKFIKYAVDDFELMKKEIQGFDFTLEMKKNDITLETCKEKTAQFFNMQPEDLDKNTRVRKVVQARQIGMFFSKQFTKKSLDDIGCYFGDKDHATVLHACRTVNNLIETDRKFRNDIEDLERKIKL